MSDRTSPEVESTFDAHDNDTQSETNTYMEDFVVASDNNGVDAHSTTVLARYGSDSGRCSLPDPATDPEESYRREPGVNYLEGLGTQFLRYPGTDLPGNEGDNPQELRLESDTVVPSALRRSRRGEGPWSPLDPIMDVFTRMSVEWIMRMYQQHLVKRTKMTMQVFLNIDVAGCAGDVERTWIGTRDVRRHLRIAYDTISTTVVVLAFFALITLRTYGVELSFMVIYGLVLLAIGVLAVIRLLFA
ncbi:hypothetical protein MMC18_005026 [Xylographa bjoerkii]|nr:hypothetical protein [Xylographa bjoerkii]